MNDDTQLPPALRVRQLARVMRASRAASLGAPASALPQFVNRGRERCRT